MPLFIVRPATSPRDFEDAKAKMGDLPVDPDTRRVAARELIDMRKSDPRAKEIDHWIDSMDLSNAVESDWSCSNSLTRTVLVNLSHAQAGQLEADIHDVLLFEDCPLEAPSYDRGGKPAGPIDLWHLPAVGIAEERPVVDGGAGSGVVVALMDTGVAEHPELSGRVVQWSRPSGLLARLRGHGSQFLPTERKDSHSHGTAMAGLIAGAKAGIAPCAEIQSFAMLPNGSGAVSDFVVALEAVARMGSADVVNVSAGLRGAPAKYPTLAQTIAEISILPMVLVAAIGNDGAGSSRCPGNLGSVVSVGATDSGDHFWEGNGTYEDADGHSAPEFVAPGVDVFCCELNGSLERRTGTSIAAAIASGVIARLLWEHRGLTSTAQEIRDLARKRSREIGGAGPKSYPLIRAASSS